MDGSGKVLVISPWGYKAIMVALNSKDSVTVCLPDSAGLKGNNMITVVKKDGRLYDTTTGSWIASE